MRRILAISWLILLSVASILRAEEVDQRVRMGVQSLLSSEQVLREWGPTADYLSGEISGYRFEIVPLGTRAAEEAVRDRKIDFLLTDPADYVRLEVDHGIRRILTLVTLRNGVACDTAGSVVVALASNPAVKTFASLSGKRFAAVGPDSFDGWIATRHELNKHGIDPVRDCASVSFLQSPRAVVQAIIKGTADAVTLASDDFAQILGSGEIPEDALRVIQPRLRDLVYPLESSTPLHPEWPLAALRYTEDHLAKRVVMALLKLGPRDPPCLASGTAGWTIPLNYGPVHEVLRDLRLPPYQRGRVKLEDAVREYRYPLIVAVALMLGLAGGIAYVIRLSRANARLAGRLEIQLSERERAERALSESEALYHSLVETLPQNIFRKNVDERFTFVNRRFCAIVGKSAEEILGRADGDLFPSEMAEKYRADDSQVMRTRSPHETIEQHVTPDGELRYVHVIKSPLIDHEGNVTGIQGIFWDVTGKKRAEEELARSEERFALAVRGSNDGIWDWNIESDEIYFSPRLKELLGFPDHELPNRLSTHFDRIHPEDFAKVNLKIKRHLKEHAPFDIEYRLKTRSGEYLWFHARGQALWNAEGRAMRMAGSLSDITSRKMSEDQLLAQNDKLQEMARSERRTHQELKQAQSRMVSTAKLAGLGEMVAGVAHEINNPLSFVSNNVCVLERDLTEVTELVRLYRSLESIIGEASPAKLQEIRDLWESVDVSYTLSNLPRLLSSTRDGLRRIQQIVKDLRVFARLDESDLNEVDLNAGIESTLNIVLGHAKKKQIRIDVDLQKLPMVTCYPAKINQVFMNLISNAIDASFENGVIAVRTIADSSGIRIEVEDHGTGIALEVRERIFDPFFTTKPVGVGTGLGLSISYGILQDHGGTIEVESEPGCGTKFTICLPLRPLPKAKTTESEFHADAPFMKS